MGVQESSQSLVTLSHSDLGRERLRGNYSRLKLGCTRDVDHYADLLARQLLLVGDLATGGWMVTSPPMRALPSAANLLAMQVVRLLQSHGRSNIWLRPLRKRSDLGRFPHKHFAGLDAETRRDVLAHSAATTWLPDAQFAGASVIVIDDARITGSNEATLRRFLHWSGVRRLVWAYLLDLRLDTATDASTAEPRLNSLFFDERVGLADALRDGEIEPTTWLVWTLFGMQEEEFGAVRDVIRPSLAARIVSLLRSEGFEVAPDTAKRWAFFEERSNGGKPC